MLSNSSESEATMRLCERCEGRERKGADADGQEKQLGTVAHNSNLATSAGYADNDDAGANQSELGFSSDGVAGAIHQPGQRKLPAGWG